MKIAMKYLILLLNPINYNSMVKIDNNGDINSNNNHN